MTTKCDNLLSYSFAVWFVVVSVSRLGTKCDKSCLVVSNGKFGVNNKTGQVSHAEYGFIQPPDFAYPSSQNESGGQGLPVFFSTEFDHPILGISMVCWEKMGTFSCFFFGWGATPDDIVYIT